MPRKFQRARRPEQKEQRREQLLRTARALLAENETLEELSLNQLARRARMAKSNVYRYFESREALLLEVLWQEWASWFAGIENQLALTSGGKRDARTLVGWLGRSLAENKLLCALTAALPTVLEAKLSESAIRAFKEASLRFFHQAAAKLEAAAPELPAQRYAEILHDAACLLSALYPHSHPAKSVADVLKDPGLRFFKRDLATDLERMLVALALTSTVQPGPKPPT
jgi:AcrR family transcriptional regulator